jgi:hypothetical protein
MRIVSRFLPPQNPKHSWIEETTAMMMRIETAKRETKSLALAKHNS